MKKLVNGFICGVVATTVIIGSISTYAWSTKEKISALLKHENTVMINGQLVNIRSIEYGNNNYVPIKEICEALNKEVEWDKEKKQVVVNGRNEADAVKLSSKGLENAIRYNLNRDYGNIYKSDLEKIKFLCLWDNISDTDINDLNYFTSLEELDIQVSGDIDKLVGFKKLGKVNLHEGSVDDFSGLINIEELDFGNKCRVDKKIEKLKITGHREV